MEVSSSAPIKGSRILVVDDHRNIRLSLKMTLEGEGASIMEAENCAAARKLFGHLEDPAAFPFQAVLLDIRMPDGSGLDLLKELNEASLASRVIMISGEGTVSDAFQATQNGAFDFIEKPFGEERIIVSVGRCLGYNRIASDNARLTKQVMRGQEILGDHPKVHEILSLIGRVAPTQGRVLITGESGTGKELVARAIHRQSSRRNQELVKVNCAAIPQNLIESELFGHEKGAFTGAIKTRKGVFERADGGTLFLDEIGELELDVQAKLLRVLQNGELQRVGSEKTITVDVRLLAATNRDLAEMVQAGEFREDLFYRLNVVTINTPSLRERATDIPALAEHFLSLACEENSLGLRSFSQKALEQLQSYRWPGNIRELKNIVERVAILSDHDIIQSINEIAQNPAVQEDFTPGEGGAAITGNAQGEFAYGCNVQPWQEFHTEAGRSYIKYILRKSQGNVSEAARLLCLERAYLHRLMKKLGVQRDVVVLD